MVGYSVFNRHAILGGVKAMGRAFASGVEYLLQDEFTSDDSAPVTSPRTCEPGPGTMTITDTNSIMSISSGSFHFNGTPAGTDGVYSSQYARTAGRAFFLKITDRTAINTNIRAGWSATTVSGSDINIGFDFQSTTTIRIKAVVSYIASVNISTATQFASIQRGSGGFLFYKNTSDDWDLLWVYDSPSSAQYAKLYMGGGAVNFKSDSWRVADLPAPFDTDNGMATDANTGNVTASTTMTHEADFVLEFTVTTMPSADNIDRFFRIQDASNYWIARVTSGGALDLIEVVAGSETSRGSGGTVTNGERIIIIADDESIIGYADNSQAWSYSGAANFKTETAGELDSLGTGGAVEDDIVWPRTLSGTAASVLEEYTE